MNVKNLIMAVMIGVCCCFAGEIPAETEASTMIFMCDDAKKTNMDFDDKNSGVVLQVRIMGKNGHSIQTSMLRELEEKGCSLIAKDSNIKNLGEVSILGSDHMAVDQRGCIFSTLFIHVEKLPSEGARWVQLIGEIPIEIWGTKQTAEIQGITWEKGETFSCEGLELKIEKYKKGEEGKIELGLSLDRKGVIEPIKVLGIIFTDKAGNKLELAGDEVRERFMFMRDGENMTEVSFVIPAQPHGIKINYIKKLEGKTYPLNVRFPMYGVEEESVRERKEEGN